MYVCVYIYVCRYIHMYVCVVYILFQILFPCRLLQNVEYSSLCYTVGTCWLPILYIVVYTCSSQTPDLSLPAFPLENFSLQPTFQMHLHPSLLMACATHCCRYWSTGVQRMNQALLPGSLFSGNITRALGAVQRTRTGQRERGRLPESHLTHLTRA